ncbi:hypothetical protein ACTSKR_16680 [Chitinibacteraceae bacterium HSL-7]
MTRWQRIRQEGWLRCVVWRGALGWGLMFSLAYATVELLTGRSAEFLPVALDALPLGLAGGAFYGWGQWGYCQLQVLKDQHDQDSP